MTTLPRKGSLPPFPFPLSFPPPMGKHLSAHSTNLLPARGQIIANDLLPLLPHCPPSSTQSLQVICWLGRYSIPVPVPAQSRTCRGHIRRCDKADADLPALSLAWGQPAVPACACVIVASHPSASAMGHLQCSIIAPLSGVFLGCFWWQLRWGWPFCVVVVAHSSTCGSR